VRDVDCHAGCRRPLRLVTRLGNCDRPCPHKADPGGVENTREGVADVSYVPKPEAGVGTSTYQHDTAPLQVPQAWDEAEEVVHEAGVPPVEIDQLPVRRHLLREAVRDLDHLAAVATGSFCLGGNRGDRRKHRRARFSAGFAERLEELPPEPGVGFLLKLGDPGRAVRGVGCRRLLVRRRFRLLPRPPRSRPQPAARGRTPRLDRLCGVSSTSHSSGDYSSMTTTASLASLPSPSTPCLARSYAPPWLPARPMPSRTP
jgi:hypothetical protein